VARPLRRQHEVRAAILRSLVLIEGLLTLALVGIAWLSVTNGLLPLARMRTELDAREGGDLTPVGGGDVPYELAPVVAAFNDLLRKVGDSARAREDFLADMAHQLRTPLAGLSVQLDVLAGRHTDPDSARALDMMRSASERMTRQVNQLLALARAEPSHFERTRLEPLALDGLLAKTIQQFVEQAARKDIDLGFELAPTTVRGDRFLLRDLVDNLIDNALRYTPAGGTVTVACRQDGDAGVFTVEDSGPGIAPARRQAVFSRFVRLDGQEEGSGLGLTIVRDIAAAHGATVTIGTAAGGHGALFTVRFPR
jgi:two-component system sensor histidine kinase TctE